MWKELLSNNFLRLLAYPSAGLTWVDKLSATKLNSYDLTQVQLQ